MVFTSQIFLFYFLPLVLALYYALPHRHRNLFLTLASYVFYGWWSPWFVTLMLTSTAIDWFCGIAITRPGATERARRTGVFVSIAANLALLGFFKYFTFVQVNLNRLLEVFGSESLAVWTIVLPVGISFYSFQSMSYSVDLYRGEAERARRFVDFACYVAMFPQLVAGPIVRYREVCAQLVERPQRGEQFRVGALGFMIGFTKKVLLANTLGEMADVGFGAEALGPAAAWLAITAYAFQIYFDFSGYSDMAIGLGHMLGFRLPINFRSPYRAESITDFWRRWHVSLSSWLRDYLYIPLGGNRGGIVLTYRNLMITMVLGGFWHGAQWTFLVWGAYHGLWLALERLGGKSLYWSLLPRTLRVALTFVLVLLSWVPFRSSDLGATWEFLGALFGAGGGGSAEMLTGRLLQPFYLFALVVAAAVVWLGTETQELVERSIARPLWSVSAYSLFLLAVVAMFSQAENPFLYFQF
jgi:alginate O-acetyltransferase complex protein AlgI